MNALLQLYNLNKDTPQSAKTRQIHNKIPKILSLGLGLGLIAFILPMKSFANSPYYYDDSNYAQYNSQQINGANDSIAYKNYAENTFIFSPRTLQWRAMKDGRVVRTGHGSAGRSYCPDIKRSCRTPTGTFYISRKGGADCRSSRYPLPNGGARMPYCMFFSKYYAIHGSSDVPNYNASHGCVRVQPSDARWLSENFLHSGSKVIIQSY